LTFSLFYAIIIKAFQIKGGRNDQGQRSDFGGGAETGGEAETAVSQYSMVSTGAGGTCTSTRQDSGVGRRQGL